MKRHAFEVVVSGLPPGEAESLRLEFARAAIRVARRGNGGAIVIESRSNAVFSSDDVLDVLASWIEKKPERFVASSFSVQRAACRASALRRLRRSPLLATFRGAPPAPIGTPAIEQQAAN